MAPQYSPAPPLLLSSTRLGGPENKVPKSCLIIMMIDDGNDNHVVITVVFPDDLVVTTVVFIDMLWLILSLD